MVTQAEGTVRANALADRVEKIHTEIIELKRLMVEAGGPGGQLTPEMVAALARAEGAAAGADEENPDAPV